MSDKEKTDDVRIELKRMPKCEQDSLCAFVISAVRRAFEDESFRKGYESWLKERGSAQ